MRELRKSRTMRQIETKMGGSIEEVLRSMYVDQDMSTMLIAQTLGISYVTANKWLHLAGVRSRKLRVDKG